MGEAASIWVQLLGAEISFVDVDGVRTRTIRAGDGPDLILLHGGGGHAEAYARNVMALAAQFRVHALDFLGHGLTGAHAESTSRSDYVEHLVGYMDAVGIGRAHLLGESLGGWIAAWTAITEPSRVDRLVYVCGARLVVPVDEESERRTAAGRAELARRTEQLLAEPSRANVRERLAWLFHDPARDLTDELVDLRWTLYQSTTARGALTHATAAPSASSAADALTPDVLAGIACPTLVLWTSHNPSATAEVGRLAASYIPKATFELMDGCGHWPQWEDPATFNRIVADYLRN